MRKYLLYSLLAGFGIMIPGCLLTMMIVFTGGSFSGADLSGLLLAQAAMIPIALGVIVLEVSAFVRLNGWRTGIRLLWQKIPAWLVLVLLLLNSLVFLGELSVLLLNRLTGVASPWTEHVPLISLLACSLAFAIVYGKAAQLYWNGITRLGRWP
jgi:hypothetical protein